MKKAKLMFSAITVIAIAAGLSAFSAKDKFGSIIWKAPTAGTQATLKVDNFTLISNGSTITQTGLFTSVQNAVVNSTVTAYSSF